MIKVRRPQVFTVIVVGFGPKTKKNELKKPAEQYADFLQDRVAKLYDSEQVAAGKLSANSKAWNAFKKKNGFETKRGHMTGNTQSVLDTSTKIMDIDIRGKRGQWRVVIRMNRSTFYKEVGNLVKGRSYIEFYEENKVPNERITAFKMGWTRNGRKFFKHLEG